MSGKIVLDLSDADYTSLAEEVYQPYFVDGRCMMIAYKNDKIWRFEIDKNGNIVSEAEEFNLEALWY